MAAQLRPIRMEDWPRREHYEHFIREVPCGLAITAEVDITPLVSGLGGRRFYPAFLYLITRTVNAHPEFRMGLTEDGRPGVWDEVVPSHTVFHPEDETFTRLSPLGIRTLNRSIKGWRGILRPANRSRVTVWERCRRISLMYPACPGSTTGRSTCRCPAGWGPTLRRSSPGAGILPVRMGLYGCR